MAGKNVKLTERQKFFLQVFVEEGGCAPYQNYKFHIGRGANPHVTIKALESRGLIELTPDHRKYSITDAGRAALNGQ